MFLIRAVFWLSIVIAFIPVDPSELGQDQRPVSTMETLSAAQALIHDLSGFCDRNAETCATGEELFAQFGTKARTGLGYVMAWTEKAPAGGTAGATGADTVAQKTEAQIKDAINTGAINTGAID